MPRVEAKRREIFGVLSNCAETAAIPGLTVEQVMTANPTCVDLKTNAWELAKLFLALRFRHLLVTDEEGSLVAVVSDRDIIRCLGRNPTLSEDYLERISVQQLMSTDLITVRPETLVLDGVRLLIEHSCNCLPVVTNGRPVGIVTSTDLYLLLEGLLEASRVAEVAI